MRLKMRLIDILAQPHVGNLSWDDMMKIETALGAIDRHADSMDREAEIGDYAKQETGDQAAATVRTPDMSLDFATRCQPCGAYGPAVEACCVECGTERPSAENLKSLRDVIEAAEYAVETFRNPDINDAVEQIDEVLKSIGGMGWIGNDEVTSISINQCGDVTVTTLYSVRSCDRTDRYKIPHHIIDADDPIAAAKQFGKNERVEAARRKVSFARDGLKSAEQDLRSALAE